MSESKYLYRLVGTSMLVVSLSRDVLGAVGRKSPAGALQISIILNHLPWS